VRPLSTWPRLDSAILASIGQVSAAMLILSISDTLIQSRQGGQKFSKPSLCIEGIIAPPITCHGVSEILHSDLIDSKQNLQFVLVHFVGKS